MVAVLALALGALWLACTLRIASTVDCCVAVKAAEFTVWGDGECRASIKIMAPLGVLSPILMAVAVRLEVKAEVAEADAQIRKAAGPGRLERLIMRACNAATVFISISISLVHVSVILMGMLLRKVGALILEYYYSGDEGIALLMSFGSDFEYVAYLSLFVLHLCLAVPYAVLRLRWFLLNKIVSLD